MQTKKRKMKAGEAVVGIKRSGSQLSGHQNISIIIIARPEHNNHMMQYEIEATHLRRQNMFARSLAQSRQVQVDGYTAVLGGFNASTCTGCG